jgi:hypothetical protein
VELQRGGDALQNIHKNSNELGIAADFIATNSADIFNANNVVHG